MFIWIQGCTEQMLVAKGQGDCDGVAPYSREHDVSERPLEFSSNLVQMFPMESLIPSSGPHGTLFWKYFEW